MTVRKLIEALLSYESEAEIVVQDGNTGVNLDILGVDMDEDDDSYFDPKVIVIRTE